MSLQLSSLENLTKTDLIKIAKKYRIKNLHSKRKNDIIDMILSFEDTSEKINPILKVENINYEKIYHISDIHIRPLKRHKEYSEVFENLYSFLESKNTKNIIAITGDILHEKDNLKPETVLLCRTFIKNLTNYGTVVIITGNHDMLENNSDRLDNLTAIVDDLPIHYLKDSGAYVFGNTIVSVSSLIDKKFITRNQIINNKNLPVISLYHGTLNGSVTDIGYKIEDIGEHSTRFRKISDFDGFDLVLLGDIHKHQYLKPHIAYPGSLIQQNFGENLTEHGVLEWDIKSKESVFYPVKNRYGFINICVKNEKWELPQIVPEKPYVRLLMKETSDDYSEIIREAIEEKFDVQSFQTKQITDDMKEFSLLPEEVTYHENDLEILKKEMESKGFEIEKKQAIFEIHNNLKTEVNEELNYDMNNQNWKIIQISFKNVFIFGDNKVNTINFSNLEGITTIVGPNAIGKSNIINIIIFLLYGSNINFKVPHILNKYQNDYFIECEIVFGTKRYKIKKTGKKRKGSGQHNYKINHSFSLYSFEDDWVKQDKENNKGTSKIIKDLLGTVEQFLLTNVYSNSSLKTLLTLSNTEKHKALSKLFCLDIYENLEKEAKKNILELKKQCLYLEGEKRGLLYNFEEGLIEKLREKLSSLRNEKERNLEIFGELKQEVKKLEERISKAKTETTICYSQIKNVEFIDFENIKKDFKEKYDIVFSENIHEFNLEKLTFEYYKLKGSLVEIPYTPELNRLDEFSDKKDYLEKKLEGCLTKIKEKEEKQKNIQENIFSLKSQIINISNNELKDKLNEIKDLEVDCEDILFMSVEDAEKELISVKSKIIDFKLIDIKTENLDKNYDDRTNQKNIDLLERKIQIKEKPLISFPEFGDVKDIPGKIKELRESLSVINILPEIKGISNIEDAHKIVQSNKNSVSEKEIQKYIDIFINSPDGIDKENIIDILKKIKETFIFNRKSVNVLHYIDLYNKNTINEKKNKGIHEKIEYLEYLRYKKLKKELKKCKNLSYSYKYSLYEKSKKLEKYLRYKKLKIYQEKYNSFLKNVEENNKINLKLEKQRSKLSNVKEKISKLSLGKKDLEDCLQITLSKIRDIHLEKKNVDILNSMDELKSKIDECKIYLEYKKINSILEKEEEYIKTLEENQKNQEIIKNNEELIDELGSKVKMQNEKYMKIKVNIVSTENEVNTIESKIKELNSAKIAGENIESQLKELQKDVELYEEYAKLINKNNIPAKLIKKKNSYIEEHINTFLEKLVQFKIAIESDTKNGIHFYAKKKGLILDINQLSGYETFILNIALKSALSKYSFISKSTLFILDEGLDVVDKDNFKKLDLLMKLLMKNYKNILLISHMPKVKELQNHSICIQNNGKSSYIV